MTANPSIEELTRLASDPDKDVRYAVARNPQLDDPATAMQLLINGGPELLAILQEHGHEVFNIIPADALAPLNPAEREALLREIGTFAGLDVLPTQQATSQTHTAADPLHF